MNTGETYYFIDDEGNICKQETDMKKEESIVLEVHELIEEINKITEDYAELMQDNDELFEKYEELLEDLGCVHCKYHTYYDDGYGSIIVCNYNNKPDFNISEECYCENFKFK